MHLTFPLTALVLLASPVVAAPLTLTFAGPATEIGERVEVPVSYALPVAAFDGARVPVQQVQGALDQHAYRLDGVRDNTLALMQPLRDQVLSAGFKPVFECDTTACGGFDFRFGTDVLPEPQMHVDLGDFRFLAAVNAAGEAVSLLVSRSADQGFVQVTTISASVSAPALKVAAAAEPAKPPNAKPPNAEVPPAEPLAPVVAPEPEVKPMVAAPDGSLVERLERGASVALDDLIFASGKADLQDQDYASLGELADWLAAHPEQKVTLVGHTDASGTLAGNVALSKQRAASVRDWLVKRYKAAAGQIDAQGAGFLAPRASNQTPEGRTQNRRVEVMISSVPLK